MLAVAMLPLDAQTQPQLQDHLAQYSAEDVANGSRLYNDQCALCHGPGGDAVAAVDLRRGRFRRPMSDDDLRQTIRTGISDRGMPSFASLAESELDGVIAYIRAGLDVSGTAVRIGDASRGQAIFAGKGSCAGCHRVHGSGPYGAPDLSDIGALRTASVLQRILLEPTEAMWPINRPVRIVTRDGETIRGRRLNEDTYTVQVIDSERGRLRSFTKADLRTYELAAASLMPSMAGTLTGDELADLIAYLLSLRGLP
jgi:putative heme-binding domain-containing protein